MKRGQAAVEFVVLFGLGILILIPILLMLFSETRTQHEAAEEAKINDMGNQIIDQIASINRLGRGSWLTFEYSIPEGVTNVRIQGNELVISYITADGPKEAVYYSEVDLEGAGMVFDDIQPGINKVKLESRGTYVCISGEAETCGSDEHGCENGVDDDNDYCIDQLDRDCLNEFGVYNSTWNETGIEGCVESTCGNGVIDNPDEMCDLTDTGDENCASQGFPGGELVCNQNCTDFDNSSCWQCGNGVIENFPGIWEEECDIDSYPPGTNCMQFIDPESSNNYDGGSVGCDNENCVMNLSACWRCGNGLLEGSDGAPQIEQCEIDLATGGTDPDTGHLAACNWGYDDPNDMRCDRTTECQCEFDSGSPIFSKEPPHEDPHPGGMLPGG
ncbi:hypothetical protein JW868_00600 [Candidatus Woesearchaeota archaeon]|nr:hypothetical protein [Candidatus Woesearchaeota archaeon]